MGIEVSHHQRFKARFYRAVITAGRLGTVRRTTHGQHPRRRLRGPGSDVAIAFWDSVSHALEHAIRTLSSQPLKTGLVAIAQEARIAACAHSTIAAAQLGKPPAGL